MSYTPNAAKTGGELDVTDGALHAKITLFGNYVAAGFHLVKDPAGGTAVTYHAPTAAHLDFAAGQHR